MNAWPYRALSASCSLIGAVAVFFQGGCSTIAPYDQAAYEHVTNAKVETLLVMGKATDSYASHKAEIERLQVTLDKAYEYDRNRPLNSITVRMWEKLRDPERDLLGGFLREWQEDGPLLPKYVQNKRQQIGEAFDTISQLESGKLKATEVAKKL